MTSAVTSMPLDPAVEEQIARVGPVDVAVALLTYNNAETAREVAEAAALGVEKHLPEARAALVNVDVGSADGTVDTLRDAGLPLVRVGYDSPLAERVAVPFHGVPGRGPALRTTLAVAHRLGARGLILLEADLVSLTDEWIDRLATPVWEQGADLVLPAYARHRYDGTITNLVIAPLVRALYGRRIRQPLGGTEMLSGRLVEHLLVHPQWRWTARDLADLWIAGAAIADGFSVWEAWVGRRVVHSTTRTHDLPEMMVQTLGAAFSLMDRHQDLWLEVRGSEPPRAVGEPVLPSTEPIDIDVAGLVEGFRLGLRDLVPIWEQILTTDTLADVLALGTRDDRTFAFPDDLWARTVYDYALGHHYAVVHRDHLLRSIVPLYLGRTAAFVIDTRARDAAASEARLDAVAAAFERQKPYLVERWR